MSSTEDPNATQVRTTPLHAFPDIPGYVVQRLLGEGGMAQVFLAIDEHLNRPVAVKVMSSALAASGDFQERFEDEAKIIARFRHPHVVTVHASGVVGDDRYIVQEYVEGGTLEDKINQGPLAPTQALAIARDIASALAYSHSQAIIHRDVKPANILFTGDGLAVLSDFGIAKSLDTTEARTVAGSVIGSLQYMAPEQLRGEAPSDRVDVYALGLVLIEMLQGEMPKDGLTVITDDGQATQLQRKLGNIDKPTARLLGRCLRPDPQDRPSAQTLTEELETLCARMKQTGGQPRKKGVAIAAGVGIAAILAGAYVMQPPAAVTVSVSPQQASVFIDGVLQPSNVVEVPSSANNITAVAPQHRGQSLRLQAESSTPVSIQLASWQMPSLEEFTRFTEVFAKDASAQNLQKTVANHPVYKQALSLNRLYAQSETSGLQAQQEQLLALVKAGDAPAQLVLFLAADEGILNVPQAERESYLSQASEAGYGLATFYKALMDRRAAAMSAQGESQETLLKLASDMELAASQGLSFAGAFAADARQALAGT